MNGMYAFMYAVSGSNLKMRLEVNPFPFTS